MVSPQEIPFSGNHRQLLALPPLLQQALHLCRRGLLDEAQKDLGFEGFKRAFAGPEPESPGDILEFVKGFLRGQGRRCTVWEVGHPESSLHFF
jgi:hypothetical protein